MNISVKLKHLFKLYRIPLYCCGLEVVDSNYRFNFRTLAISVVFILYYVCAVNTILTWPLRSTLELLSACGIAITGSIKLLAVTTYNKELNDIFVETDNLSVKILASGRLSRRYQIFNKYINGYKIIFKAFTAIGVVCFIIICGYPGTMYFFTKKVVFSFSCYIPFIDPLTSTGYTMTMTFHLVCLLMIIPATVGMDTLFLFVIVQCAVEVDILQVQIEEFNEILHSGKPHQDTVEKILDSIIKAHQTISSSISRIGLIFFWPIAVQVGLCVMSMAVSLFMLATTTWYVSYATLGTSLIQLLVFSVLGTFVDIKNEKVITCVYGISWHLLPLKEMKKFHIFFMNVQQTKVIYIADLAVLNVDTCVSILKSIYSFFMMILEVS